MSRVGTHSCVVCKKDKNRFRHLKFHRFPRDVSRCRKWLSSLKIACLKEKTLRQLNSSCVVCSEHFREDQYLNGRLLPSAYPVTDDKGSEPHDLQFGSEDSSCSASDWFTGTDQEKPDDHQVVALPRYDVLTTGFGVIESDTLQEEFDPELANVVTTDSSVVDSNQLQEIFVPNFKDEETIPPSSPSHSMDNSQDTSNSSKSMDSTNEDNEYLNLIHTILSLCNDEGEKISVKDKVVAMDLKTLIYIIGKRIVPIAPSETRDSGQGTDSGSESVGPKHEEYQYLDLIRTILLTGNKKDDLTGASTISLFGAQMRFSLRKDVIPVLTTQQISWQVVVEELLWFITGSTNTKPLQEKDIHTWDGSSSQEFLDKSGFMEREEGDLGPVYGFQWRHFGATYGTMRDDYTKKGIDQLKQVIETIQTSPNDQGIMMTAWNPTDIPSMALPPCHCLCQFYVAKGEVSCQVYQRSGDMGHGVPFSIASYALLTHMIAHITGLKPGELIHTLGDAHVHSNHQQALEVQLTRIPRPFPVLRIKRKVTSIDDFTFDDFELCSYNPHPKMKMDMRV